MSWVVSVSQIASASSSHASCCWCCSSCFFSELEFNRIQYQFAFRVKLNLYIKLKRACILQQTQEEFHCLIQPNPGCAVSLCRSEACKITTEVGRLHTEWDLSIQICKRAFLFVSVAFKCRLDDFLFIETIFNLSQCCPQQFSMLFHVYIWCPFRAEEISVNIRLFPMVLSDVLVDQQIHGVYPTFMLVHKSRFTPSTSVTSNCITYLHIHKHNIYIYIYIYTGNYM